LSFAATEKPKSRVGFVDDPNNEKLNSENGGIDYKDRYEKLMKELESSKKEISELKEQISRYFLTYCYYFKFLIINLQESVYKENSLDDFPTAFCR
jgi:hypothetical protein